MLGFDRLGRGRRIGAREVWRLRLHRPESLADCAACPVEYRCVSVEDERGVRGDEERLEFESELGGIQGAVQLAEMLSLAGEPLEGPQPISTLLGDRVTGGTRPGADVCRGRRKEAAAGEDPPLDMREVRLAYGE